MLECSMSRPPVLIIAGGTNSRFFPFQHIGHKGAFTLLGESLMVRTLRGLATEGFTRVVCVITPKDEELQFSRQLVEKAGLSLDISFVVQPEPQGMGDAVLHGMSALGEEIEQFAVITAYHLDAGKMLTQMLEKGSGTVLAATETHQPWEYGVLRINDTGQAIGVTEKPEKGTEPSRQKVQTVYLLSREYVEKLRTLPTAEYNFETALDQELQQHPAPIFHSQQSALTLKYPWHLFDFQETLLKQLASHRAASAAVAPTAVIDETHGPVYIGEGVQIGHCSKVVGPCYLGDYVVIGDFSLVRGSSLEQHTHIGCFAEIARSILAEDVHMHSGYIGDSVIGHNARIGAGFITANKRLDRQSVGVLVKNKVIDSGRKALGVMVGDGARIGIQVGTMPGKCICTGAVIAAKQSVDTNISIE